MKLIEREAIDFISAAQRFADRNKERDPDYPGLPEIEAWCREYEKKLSPFLLSDISLMIEKMFIPSVYFFYFLYQHPEIQTGEELLEAFRTTPKTAFLSTFKVIFRLEAEQEITLEALLEAIQNDGLHPGFDPQMESELLLSFLQEPEDFQKRLYRAYLDFYRQAYLPGRKALRDLSEEKLRWHREELANKAEDYLISLGMSNFIKEILGKGEPALYFTLFGDNDITAFWNKRTIIIGGGTDQRIRSQSARDKANTFFSCLGDAKRLEILRLTAQRPWYSTELANHFDVKPATLSYHMNKLANADLISIVKGGQRRFYYSLNKEAVKEYLGYAAQDLIGLDHNLEK